MTQKRGKIKGHNPKMERLLTSKICSRRSY